MHNNAMRTNLEKIALIAQICIGSIYILFILFIPLGALDVTLFDNRLVKILLGILAFLYLGLGIFLLYKTFSNNEKLKQLVLFSDSESTTKTTANVIKNIVEKEGRKIDGVRVTKVKIRQDDKYGFGLKISLKISNNDVEDCVDKLRCILADMFFNGLGFKFNSIDFDVTRISTRYVADENSAETQMKELQSKRRCSKKYIHEPLDSVIVDDKEKEIEIGIDDETSKKESKKERKNKEKQETIDAVDTVENDGEPKNVEINIYNDKKDKKDKENADSTPVEEIDNKEETLEK